MRVTTASKQTKTISPLSLYLREIGAIPLLTREEEQALAHRIQTYGDEAARQHMMRANLRLVVSMAKRFAPDGDVDTLMDLIQEGNLGLLRAVDRFQPERKTRFSTYGVYWIKQAMLRFLKARRMVRLPENVVDQVLKMQKQRQALYQLLGRSPTTEEIAMELNLKTEEVVRLEELATDIVSLEQTVGNSPENEPGQLQELLEDVEAPRPQQEVQKKAVRDTVRLAVETLPAREKQILELRFGLGQHQPHTLETIGHMFGISRERVRQLQNGALHRLRQRQGVIQVQQI